MIKIIRVDDQDLENTWLKEAITKGLKECLTAPLLIVNPTEPEHIMRTKMVVDNFSKENCPCIPTLIIPMQVIQVILPEEELIISIIFVPDRNTRELRVQVSLIKLIHEEDETSTTVHT